MNEVLSRYGIPEIFNTDQGSQGRLGRLVNSYLRITADQLWLGWTG